jgi:uncharacterized protein (TIGR03083 family)
VIKQQTHRDGAATWDAFGPRFDARPAFKQVREQLLDVLRALAPDDWHRLTAAAPWRVHDVVAHLLGDNVGRLSRSRDHYPGAAPRPGESVPELVHRLNDEWVTAAARASPRLLMDLLDTTTTQIMEFWRQTELDALGEAVTWAGAAAAPVWLDCARDFTEDWVHQQQIRAAVGRYAAPEPEVVHMVLETFLRAVPRTLNAYAAERTEVGAGLTIRVPGPEGGTSSPSSADGVLIENVGRPAVIRRQVPADDVMSTVRVPRR